MTQKSYPTYIVILEKIVGGGQALGTLDDGRKCFVWGGLPGETVRIQQTKKKSSYIEGIVIEVLAASTQRVSPRDPDSYLSTSPWQLMTFEAEQHYKAALIEEAFELHNIVLPEAINVYTDDQAYHYRNKVEFSWYGDTDAISGVDTLHLAFFRRGSKGKIPVDNCSLLPEPMMKLAIAVRDLMRTKSVTARNLKTLLIRCDQAGQCVWQLYLKERLPDVITHLEAEALPALGGEIIYSNPKSPASVITERFASFGDTTLTDTVLDVPFRYATEGFFQINLPVYERALKDMQGWINDTKRVARGGAAPNNFSSIDEEIVGADRETGPAPSDLRADFASKIGDDGRGEEQHKLMVVDLYAGVGSIGLTIGGTGVTLVELNEHAVREMRRNITELDSDATAVLAPSEQALDHITSNKIIIVDPPRAGLHADVIARLLEAQPPRIIYLSCNPVTQARDVALLAENYGICAHRGYNFFPRTPHIEHLVILDRKKSATIPS